jgi:hypothetical protein
MSEMLPGERVPHYALQTSLGGIALGGFDRQSFIENEVAMFGAQLEDDGYMATEMFALEHGLYGGPDVGPAGPAIEGE